MNSESGAVPEADTETEDERSRDGVSMSRSRRAVVAGGGAAALTALAGCTGLLGTADDGETEEENAPEPPWTTEELSEVVGDDPDFTIYAAAGTRDAWTQLVEVVNDEFGTSLDPDLYVSDGGDVAQRVIQERQADRDQADIISQGTALYDQIHEEDMEAGDYYELGIDENFWFSEALPDEMTEPWYVSALNGGPSTCMAINADIFEERGLDYPDTWNDLLDEQYEGLETCFPSYVVPSRIGWIVRHHAEQLGMDDEEWLHEMMDHLDFKGVESHTRGAREVGQGNIPFMFYNFPWTVRQVIDDLPVEIHYPDDIQALMSSGHLAINSEAPNPWAARFLLSAAVEVPVQRRILEDVDLFAPSRLDVDYSDLDVDPYYEELLNADVSLVTFEDEGEFTAVGERVIANVIEDR
ncbi:sugar ABC transporter substrate-binding protein [Halalkaliarchaeum desulfuricum]|uniref:Sugar ABC transporter substrate-binding protein n=1 Tax=Halalkaliarchaeum desulfuricum TaxID=2055893 RepID=A0A343TG13_9EURY|nr:extracellular solute-binding protein [Halalkaliarchaeum desulfuricum]AUX08035.1 sugar ABC transporter substrate-binding protein [Halalkaliarchaeum desulfuricum]